MSLTPSTDYIKEFDITFLSSHSPSEKIKLHKEKDFSLPLKVSQSYKG